jgi:Glycosyl hydrolases family 25
MARIGPDISHHQQQVDLARAKSHVHFVFLKATDGTGFVDGTFATRWQKLAQLGIPVAPTTSRVQTTPRPRQRISSKSPSRTAFERGAWRSSTWRIHRMTRLPGWGRHRQHCVHWSTLYQRRPAGPASGERGVLHRPAILERPDGISGQAPCQFHRLALPLSQGRSLRRIAPPAGGMAQPAGHWQFTDGVAGTTRDILGIGKVDTNEMTEACFLRLFEVGLVASVPAFTGTLKPGDRDARVEQVQRNLNRFLPPTEQLTVNGHFDAATKATLTKWQTNRRIQRPASGWLALGPGRCCLPRASRRTSSWGARAGR